MTRSLRFLVLTPILVLAACGGTSPSQPVATSGAPSQAAGSTPGAPPASADPGRSAGAGPGGTCELLSDTDIVELTSFEVDNVETRSHGGVYVNVCYWALADGGVVQAEILLGVLAEGGRAHFDTVLVPLAEGTGGEPLEGVGDAALVGSDGAFVAAVDGDVLVDLQWIELSGGSADVPIALMKRVLSNLAGA